MDAGRLTPLLRTPPSSWRSLLSRLRERGRTSALCRNSQAIQPARQSPWICVRSGAQLPLTDEPGDLPPDARTRLLLTRNLTEGRWHYTSVAWNMGHEGEQQRAADLRLALTGNFYASEASRVSRRGARRWGRAVTRSEPPAPRLIDDARDRRTCIASATPVSPIPRHPRQAPCERQWRAERAPS
jgi:hypothetical protein